MVVPSASGDDAFTNLHKRLGRSISSKSANKYTCQDDLSDICDGMTLPSVNAEQTSKIVRSELVISLSKRGDDLGAEHSPSSTIDEYSDAFDGATKCPLSLEHYESPDNIISSPVGISNERRELISVNDLVEDPRVEMVAECEIISSTEEEFCVLDILKSPSSNVFHENSERISGVQTSEGEQVANCNENTFKLTRDQDGNNIRPQLDLMDYVEVDVEFGATVCKWEDEKMTGVSIIVE